MAYRSVLVDRARLLREAAQPVKVEGTTISDEVRGPWFRVRLTIPPAGDAPDTAGARRRVVDRPTLLTDKRDETGEPVEIKHTDRIEVDSKQLGRAIYEVSGRVEPIRKKRSVMGWQATIHRVLDEQFDPA
jgi:hypothetical protein